MKIKEIHLLPLVVPTPDGGWDHGFEPDDNLHTLVEVVTDEGVTGQPISRLLGGRYREKIKPYGSLIMTEPGGLAGHLNPALVSGFKAIKIG